MVPFPEMRRLRRVSFRGKSWCLTCGPTSEAFLWVTSGVSAVADWKGGVRLATTVPE